MSARVILPVVPSTLKRIRERVGYRRPEDVPLSGVKDAAEKIRSWESGKERPTLTEAKKLATKYRVFYILFCLKELPAELPDELPLDFRRDEQKKPYLPNLRFAIREARMRQRWLRDYLRETGQKNFVPPFAADMTLTPAELAFRIREWLGVTVETVRGCGSVEDAFDLWRDAVEKRGILVLTNDTHKSYKITSEEYDGLAIPDEIAPVILLNPGRKLRSARSIFTLMHELAHLLLGDTAVSVINFRSQYYEDIADKEVRQKERWCNRVAAEVIAPSDWLGRVWSRQEDAGTQIEEIANEIKVSRQMLAVQARQNHFIDRNKLEELLEKYTPGPFDNTQSGGITVPENTAIKRCGTYFSRCVLDAYQSGFIMARDIYDLTGLKLKYLSAFAKKLDYPLIGWQ